MPVPYVDLAAVHSEMIDFLKWPESELIHPRRLVQLADEAQEEYEYKLDIDAMSEVA